MRIYLIPYTYKTYLNANQFHSGIDVALLSQFRALQDLGHEVGMFCAFGNVQNVYPNVDFIADQFPDNEKLTRRYYQNVQKYMLERIADFQPDVILSNYIINDVFYKNLSRFNVPIIYYSHAMPGSWADVKYGNFLYEFTKRNTFCCLSNFQYNKIVEFYRSRKKGAWEWQFDEVIPDFVLPSQGAESNTSIQPHDNTVRHISALNREKSTFRLFDMLTNSCYNFEIYTSSNYKGFLQEEEKYYNTYASKYSTFHDHVNLNELHDKTMEVYGKSICNFVGLASYDTFTITSLESLIRGVPLIVELNKNGQHPAFDMLPKEIADKYIKGVEKRKTKPDEFQKIVDSFAKFTLKDRQELSNHVLSVLGKDKYLKNLQSLINTASKKYNDANTNFGLEEFM